MEKQQLDKKISEFLSGFKKTPAPETGERQAETPPEQVEQSVERAGVKERAAVAPKEQAEPDDASAVLPSAPAPVKADTVKSPLYYQVEAVLAEGLEMEYQKLSPTKQLEFKQQGEITASKIAVLLKSAKVKVKEIFNLILSWLKIIPGLNKFFLEQEAKIKADRILALKSKIVVKK